MMRRDPTETEPRTSKCMKPIHGGQGMQSPIVFSEAELQRIGVVCPECRTEAIFDLKADHTANVNRECVGCGDAKFLESFTLPQRKYNTITYYKAAGELSKSGAIRFYFEQS